MQNAECDIMLLNCYSIIFHFHGSVDYELGGDNLLYHVLSIVYVILLNGVLNLF